MQLEVGKRYVLRNGEVTERLENSMPGWLEDKKRGRSWLIVGGKFYDRPMQSEYDIVSEYAGVSDAAVNNVEPQPSPEPLRWVENCKPDKPGIWAWQYTEWNSVTNISGIISPGDLAHAASKGVRWCYLGPIPEILPPKKKVVQRLWVQLISSLPCDRGDYKEIWLPDGQSAIDSHWIRTDRTREVEQ